jgi:hypothetical protein
MARRSTPDYLAAVDVPAELIAMGEVATVVVAFVIGMLTGAMGDC